MKKDKMKLRFFHVKFMGKVKWKVYEGKFQQSGDRGEMGIKYRVP